MQNALRLLAANRPRRGGTSLAVAEGTGEARAIATVATVATVTTNQVQAITARGRSSTTTEIAVLPMTTMKGFMKLSSTKKALMFNLNTLFSSN